MVRVCSQKRTRCVAVCVYGVPSTVVRSESHGFFTVRTYVVLLTAFLLLEIPHCDVFPKTVLHCSETMYGESGLPSNPIVLAWTFTVLVGAVVEPAALGYTQQLSVRTLYLNSVRAHLHPNAPGTYVVAVCRSLLSPFIVIDIS